MLIRAYVGFGFIQLISCGVILHEGTIHGGDNHVEHSAPQSYEFGYKVKDPHGSGHFQKESGVTIGHSNKKVGSYGLQDADGRWRVVNYIADDHGFRASIETNEPGTGNSDPASVVINGPDSHGAPPLTVSAGHGHGHDYEHGHGHPQLIQRHDYPVEHHHDPHGHGHSHGHGHHQPDHNGIIPAGVPLGPPVIGIPLIDNFKSSSSSSSSTKAEGESRKVFMKRTKVVHSSTQEPRSESRVESQNQATSSTVVQSRDVPLSTPAKSLMRRDRNE